MELQALMGRWRSALLGLALLVVALGAAPRAWAQQTVGVSIVVIEATRSGGGVDKRLQELKLTGPIEDAGFTQAKVMDELETQVALEASVTLEILKKGGQARTLKVTVLDVDANNDVVKLEVSIPEFEFKTTTNHKKGGRLVVAHKRGKDTALFLAVTPKLAP
jgi:hypothetical protein